MAKTVAVTGASGYLATEIIKQLVEKGYNVVGTVRDLHNPDKVKHLLELFPVVKLVEADLLKEGSFDKAFEGAHYVIHAASPFLTEWKDPQVDLVDPALKGTKNVLSSVAKIGSVKQVVVTSSAAAVVQEHRAPDESKVWTEADWNITSTLTEGPYRLSKRLAEEAAWNWAKEHPNVKVVTICPTFILGPPYSSRTDATSIRVVKSFLDGSAQKDGVSAVAFGCVDVRDVAKAHIAALENPNSSGRYMVTSELAIPRLELVNLLKPKFGHYPLPDKQVGNISLPLVKYSNAKMKKELGIELTPIEKSMNEMAQQLIDLGLVEKRT